ncbi:MAG: hypothetical protein ABI664_13875 [bacterium]
MPGATSDASGRERRSSVRALSPVAVSSSRAIFEATEAAFSG